MRDELFDRGDAVVGDEVTSQIGAALLTSCPTTQMGQRPNLKSWRALQGRIWHEIAACGYKIYGSMLPPEVGSVLKTGSGKLLLYITLCSYDSFDSRLLEPTASGKGFGPTVIKTPLKRSVVLKFIRLSYLAYSAIFVNAPTSASADSYMLGLSLDNLNRVSSISPFVEQMPTVIPSGTCFGVMMMLAQSQCAKNKASPIFAARSGQSPPEAEITINLAGETSILERPDVAVGPKLIPNSCTSISRGDICALSSMLLDLSSSTLAESSKFERVNSAKCTSFVEALSFASPALFRASPASTIECGSATISNNKPSIKTIRELISIRLFDDSSGGNLVGLNGNRLNSETSSPATPTNTIAVPTTCSQSQTENDDIADNIHYRVSIWCSSIIAGALGILIIALLIKLSLKNNL